MDKLVRSPQIAQAYLNNKMMSEEDFINVEKRKKMEGYKIVRTFSAGVFAGELESREGKEVTLRNARRIWYWDGAATLSQLATDGTAKPEKCKFPCVVDRVVLTEAIEILDVTERARESIESVPVWKN